MFYQIRSKPLEHYDLVPMTQADEIQVKISDLRGAAEQMRTSCLRIDELAQSVKGIVQALYDAGYDGGAGAFALLYAQSYSAIDDWVRDLSGFAGKLSGAADDVEEAIRPRFASLETLYKASGRNITDLNAITSAIAPLDASVAGAAGNPRPRQCVSQRRQPPAVQPTAAG